MHARTLLAAALLLVLPTSALAEEATSEGARPGARYEPATGSTVLTWTHEPGTVAHVVLRNGQEVARLPPGHTSWTDARPDTVTSYRVDSLRADGGGWRLDFVVLVSPWRGDGPALPRQALLSPPTSETDFADLSASCTWITVMPHSEPLFLRYQDDPACSPLPPVFHWPGTDGFVEMDTFLD